MTTTDSKVSSSVESGKPQKISSGTGARGLGKAGAQPDDLPDDWQALVQNWLFWADDRLPSAGTRELYIGKIRMFLRFLTQYDPKALDYKGDYLALKAGHISAYLYHLHHVLKLTGGTRASHRNAIRSFTKFLMDEQYLKLDPFAGPGIPKPQVEEPIIQPVSGQDVAALLKVAEKDQILGVRDAAVIKLLASTGLRVSELCDLTVEDIDWREAKLTVRHGKGNRQRRSGIESLTMRALNRYLQWRRKRIQTKRREDPWMDEPEALFLTRSCTPLRDEQVRSRFRELALRAGIDPHRVNPHKFRHAAATASAEEMSVHEMNAHFGWSSQSGMAERYTQTTTSERAIAKHKQIRPLERMLAKAKARQ